MEQHPALLLPVSLNISILLREYPFLDRFAAAADLGFRTVEFWWPGDDLLDAVIKAVEAADLRVALLNADAGDLAAGERGYLGDPARADFVRANFARALDLAEALRCRTVHVLGGNAVPGMARADQLKAAAAMQRELCGQALPRGINVTLEPQNRFDTPRYMFQTTADALAQIEVVGAPNLRLQYDVYHAQRGEGRIVETLRSAMPQIGHIQIADVPGRHQPGTGELNYPFIFEQIRALGYAGYIGLEYLAPAGNTAASLGWLPREDRSFLPPTSS